MKVAAYTGTRNLYPMMLTAAKSLLAHSDVDRIYFLIEDSTFPYEIPEEIKCINVAYQRFFHVLGANWRSKFTYMAMMRATYAKLFPELDKILSLDVDTIVVDDISDLWDLPIDDYYLAAAEEPKATAERGYMYFNIGVALYNLDNLRDGKVDEVIKNLNSVEYPFMEQDAFSELCKGKIYRMEPEYNYTEFTSPSGKPKIVHYAGIKEWTDRPEYQKYEKMTFSESKKNRKIKKANPKYLIHTYPGRKWYVDEYLIPSMLKQGIKRDSITVWNDDSGMGNLESCMRCFETMPDDDGGTWHLQDDVIISSRFRELTERFDDGIVCGFSNEIFDGPAVQYTGFVPMDFAWFSFQCNRIPNKYARGCAEWYYNEVVSKDLYHDLTKDGRCDDSIWQKYASTHLGGKLAFNLAPNIVDHIDYLIGGTSINFSRNGELRRAYYWQDEDAVEQLEKDLAKRRM